MFMKHPAIGGAALTSRSGMCFDPLIAAGAVLSGVGAISAGSAAAGQARAQSKVLREQAVTERRRAAEKESDFRRSQSRLMAARRAAMGAGGVDPSQGSPLLAAEDFASEVELQALRIRSGGDIRATRLEQAAHLQRAKARSEATGGFLRGGSLLLTGIGKAF